MPSACIARRLEVAIALSPDDIARGARGVADLAGHAGHRDSGSAAGRNIDRFYVEARASGVPCGIGDAVRACFGGAGRSAVRHVLIASGFYVVHALGGNDGSVAGVAAGSCETDGPLGAMALVRAFASRGVRVSVYCEAHNGPVLRAAYDGMLAFLEKVDGALADQLRRHVRTVTCEARAPAGASLYDEARAQCIDLATSVARAWGDVQPGPIDCLFALERLGAPYRNIRGHDIGAHTEKIDCLWPLAEPPHGSAAARAIGEWAREHALPPDHVSVLRRAAGVADDALSLGVGDGGNEVGMGRIVQLNERVGALRPTGNPEYCAVSGVPPTPPLSPTAPPGTQSSRPAVAHSHPRASQRLLPRVRPPAPLNRLQLGGDRLRAGCDRHARRRRRRLPIDARAGRPHSRRPGEGLLRDRQPANPWRAPW